MSGIEALWLMRSSQLDTDPSDFLAPSVIVFESLRLYGGDSASYYVGNYQINGDEVTGTATVKTHTMYPGMTNVFGMTYPIDHKVAFSARFDGVSILGVMKSEQSDLVLHFQMVRLAELP